MYVTESVIPMEIRMHNFRMLNFDKKNNEAKLRLNLRRAIVRREEKKRREERGEGEGERKRAWRAQSKLRRAIVGA